MKTFMIFVCSIILGASLAQAKRHHSSSPPPRDLIEKYLSADFNGSRINNDTAAATAKNVTWTEEPPWEQVIIVGHYHVGKQKNRRHMAKVNVKFENLGELKGDIFYPDTNVEEVTFGMVRSGGAWKIDRPILVPHISVSTAEKFVTSQLAQAKPNSDRAKTLQKALDGLKATQGGNK